MDPRSAGYSSPPPVYKTTAHVTGIGMCCLIQIHINNTDPGVLSYTNKTTCEFDALVTPSGVPETCGNPYILHTNANHWPPTATPRAHVVLF